MLPQGVRPARPMQEDVTMPPIKKIVMWLVVVFLLYAILTSPADAAEIFGSAWDVVKNGVANVASFFDTLIRGE
jgi:hypothetical protein